MGDAPQSGKPNAAPKVRRESRIDRFAHWLERVTEPQYNVDKAQIRDEGVVIDEPTVRFVMVAYRWHFILGGGRRFSGEGRLIVTARSVRLYSWDLRALMNLPFDEFGKSRVIVELKSPRKIRFRIPHDVGNSRYLRDYNRNVTIETSHAEAIHHQISSLISATSRPQR